MDTSFPPLDNIRRNKEREVLKPEARSLRFAVTELPRLNELVRPAANQRQRVAVHDGVLDGAIGDMISPVEQPEKLDACLHVRPPGFVARAVRVGQPANAAVGQEAANRMGDQQAPGVGKDLTHVAL